jgi:hypothetical protein
LKKSAKVELKSSNPDFSSIFLNRGEIRFGRNKLRPKLSCGAKGFFYCAAALRATFSMRKSG